MPKSIRRQFYSSSREVKRQLTCAKMKLIAKKHISIEAERKAILKRNGIMNQSTRSHMDTLSDQSAIATLVGGSIGSMCLSIATVLSTSSLRFSEDKESNASVIYQLTAAGFALGAFMGALFARRLSPTIDYDRMIVLNQEYKSNENEIRKIKVP